MTRLFLASIVLVGCAPQHVDTWAVLLDLDGVDVHDCGYVAKGGQGAAAHARHCKAGTETATKGRGDDLDRTEADGGQPTLASGAPDGPVGHDHGGAPSEPKPAHMRGQGSVPPGPDPSSEVEDPVPPNGAEVPWSLMWATTEEVADA